MPENGGNYENVKFEEAMNIAGFGKYSIYMIFLTGLTICSALLSSVDVSFLLPAAECDLDLTAFHKGLLGSAYFIGVITTSHLFGFLADTLGRRYVLLRGLLLNILIYICGSFAPNFWTFFVCKLISGIATCPFMIATVPYLGEYVPAKNRPQAILVTVSLSTLGLLYSSLIAWGTLEQTWAVDMSFLTYTPWRLFHLLCGVPSLLCVIFFFLTPESPKFLLSKGMKADTLKVLQKIYSFNSGKDPQNYPVKSVAIDTDEVAPSMSKEKGVAGVLKNVYNQTMPLFKPPYLKNLFLCIILFFVSFFCLNSVLLWLPEVTNRMDHYRKGHGGTYYLCQMLSRSHDIVNVSNTTDTYNDYSEGCQVTINDSVFITNIAISIVQPVFMLLASCVVPLVERRLAIMVIMIACSCMSFFVTWVPNAIIIIILFGGLPILINTCYNVLSSIQIELFPTYIRATAVSLALVSGRVGSIVGSQLFSQLIDTHCSFLFHLLAALLLCCAVVPFCLEVKKNKPDHPQKDDFPMPDLTAT